MGYGKDGTAGRETLNVREWAVLRLFEMAEAAPESHTQDRSA